jgi:hypothetical protein
MGSARHDSRADSKGVDDVDDGDLSTAPTSHISELRPPMPLGTVPRLAVTAEGLHLLPLDSRAAYLLSLMDGRYTLETILDVCDMPRDEAVAILRHLLELGVIELREAQT